LPTWHRWFDFFVFAIARLAPRSIVDLVATIAVYGSRTLITSRANRSHSVFIVRTLL
jgi:hypothetical protein